MLDQSDSHDPQEQARRFAQEANQPEVGLAAEFLEFLLHSKKWWLTPVILVLLLVGLLIVLGSSGLAPFIYPIF